jgi:hypothetical protein
MLIGQQVIVGGFFKKLTGINKLGFGVKSANKKPNSFLIRVILLT